MQELTSTQRRYLRGRAHHLDPVVFVGKNGISDSLIDSMDQALAAQELIKVKFVDRKDEKKELCAELEERTGSNQVGLIGHVGIFYREAEEEDKRNYDLGGV
jgi:RNA-binding protein